MKITSITAMEKAINFLVERSKGRLRMTLVANAKPRMYYENQYGVTDYIIKLPDCPYDIALTKQKDGTYAIAYDAWRGYIRSQVGDPANVTHTDKDMIASQDVASLLNAYGVFAAQEQLYEQGYTDTEISVNEEDNSYVLTASSGY